MTTINFEAIQPGMMLSKDVIHSNGRILLRADSLLTEQHIKIFKTWGISSVTIKVFNGESATVKMQDAADVIKAIERKQHIKFKYCDLNHPFMAELFRLSIKQELNQITGSQ